MAQMRISDFIVVDFTPGASGTNYARSFTDTVGAVDARTSVRTYARTFTNPVGITEQFNATPSGGTITHGDQMNAANTGYTSYFDAGLGRLLTLGDLTNTGATTYTAANNGQTVSRKRFTDLITIDNTNGLDFYGCFFQIAGFSFGRNVTLPEPNPGNGVVGNATNIRFHYCTWLPTSGSVWYPIQKFSNGSLLVEFCDISGGENSIGQTGGSMELRNNFFHRPNLASNPSGHEDLIEVFGGSANIHHNRLRHLRSDTVNTNYAFDACVNIAPGCTAVTIEDNFMDGGQECVLVDDQGGSTCHNVKVRRNKMCGHQADTFGRYNGLLNNDSLPIFSTDAQQAANTHSIVWPTTGPDVNVWAECDDLVPNRNGQTVSP